MIYFTDLWKQRFIQLAIHISQWSKDPSTRCGAVIVRPNRTILSTGYNGLPRGTTDGDLTDRDRKIRRVIHAEANAILHSAQRPEDCAIFCTHFPCTTDGGNGCSALILQSGIKQVFVRKSVDTYSERWEDRIKHSIEMLREGQIQVEVVNVDTA